MKFGESGFGRVLVIPASLGTVGVVGVVGVKLVPTMAPTRRARNTIPRSWNSNPPIVFRYPDHRSNVAGLARTLAMADSRSSRHLSAPAWLISTTFAR